MFTVEEIMSVGVQTLNPKKIAWPMQSKLMTESGIHHVPIVDDAGEVVGLVSHRDVLSASGSSLKRWQRHSGMNADN